MKKPLHLLNFLALSLCFYGCHHDSDMASLSPKRSLLPFWGGNADERLAQEGLYGPQEDEFIPLQEEDLHSQYAEKTISQPSESADSISLNQYTHAFAELADIFQNVYFNTDQHVLKRPEFFKIIDHIAAYMRSHPNMLISVHGHCDERGSESYNLALGTRRSNNVRTLLAQKGINPNRIHSVSHGKEHPVDLGHNASSWARNRRVEFKIYEKN